MELPTNPDRPSSQKAETLQSLASGPLASSIAKLSTSSRAIPSDKDFHFLYNFNEFKLPVKEIAEKSESLLKSIGTSSRILFGHRQPLIFPADDADGAYNWLVDLNDDVFQRVDASIDEFQHIRKKEEGTRPLGSAVEAGDGFQLVYGKKKKGGGNLDRNGGKDSGSLPMAVRMVSKDHKVMAERSRVPFHIPTIPRPQDEYNILVNNLNEPFQHVWLQRSDDGSRFLHPLEKFSELDFIDRSIGNAEQTKPLPLESTPFSLVEGVKELKDLAAKLRDVNEFAVDLEHNQYRTFQGLTCLMQISTRTEDFVVDTLKLRVHIGPHLREVFKDPSKRKVMHGADRDVLWLQRDFGIYVCNLFDTGQASRVLQMERNSLEYLLHHFCGVTANKEYQNADWRLRPLPDEMIKYARDDTHYLLHIYDLMRDLLLKRSADSGSGDYLLLEVYKRSCVICMQLYEKELLTDTSYLHIYGLQGADFNSEQLAIVAGLCQWRDAVARAEDESTGYILPNKMLLEIARQKPQTSGKLRRLVRSKHSFVEHNLGTIISIIRSSIGNAAAFESAADQLKKDRATGFEQTADAMDDGSDALHDHENPMEDASAQADNIRDGDRILGQSAECVAEEEHLTQSSCGSEQGGDNPSISSSRTEHFIQPFGETGIENKSSVASVQVHKKPSRALGALLGSTVSKRKPSFKTEGSMSEQGKAQLKVEQIKSTVALPFHSFSGRDEQSEPVTDVSIKNFELPYPESTDEHIGDSAEVVKLEEILPLERDLECSPQHPGNGNAEDSALDMETTDKHSSVADLANSFNECFQSLNEMRNSRQGHGIKNEGSQLKRFDYAAARKQIRFGDGREEQVSAEGEFTSRTMPDPSEIKVDHVSDRLCKDTGPKVSSQARRRQAFPASGNRSATFH